MKSKQLTIYSTLSLAPKDPIVDHRHRVVFRHCFFDYGHLKKKNWLFGEWDSANFDISVPPDQSVRSSYGGEEEKPPSHPLCLCGKRKSNPCPAPVNNMSLYPMGGFALPCTHPRSFFSQWICHVFLGEVSLWSLPCTCIFGPPLERIPAFYL